MSHKVKIRSIENLTHDVLRIVAEKPAVLNYQPGQAVDVSINKPGWESELRPFTFTSLPEEDHIEFSIKTYPDHNGVTAQLLTLKPGDELIIGDVFGDINYKGEGMFIAGGAGVTPFIAIFKSLEKEKKIGNNQLLFANKT
ncbi:MAG: flavodoxin reductase, partial [Chitinophagaceae bacterium]